MKSELRNQSTGSLDRWSNLGGFQYSQHDDTASNATSARHRRQSFMVGATCLLFASIFLISGCATFPGHKIPATPQSSLASRPQAQSRIVGYSVRGLDFMGGDSDYGTCIAVQSQHIFDNGGRLATQWASQSLGSPTERDILAHEENITAIPQESDGDKEKAGLKSCSLPLDKG